MFRSMLIMVLCLILLVCPLVLLPLSSQPVPDSQVDNIIDVDLIMKNASAKLSGAKYDSAIYYYQIACNYMLARGEMNDYFSNQIKIANIYRIKGDYQNTLDIINKLENDAVFRSMDDSILMADLLHVKGTAYSNQGQNRMAMPILSRSIDYRIKINGENDTLLTNTYNNLGNCNLFLGNISMAKMYYEKAIDLALEYMINPVNPDLGQYYQNLGIVFANMGDFDQAEQYFSKNLNINRKLLSEDDPKLATIYVNVGRLSYLLEKRDEALEKYDIAERIFKKKFGEEYGSLGVIYLNKGNIYNDNRDFQKALEYYKNALQIYRKNYTEGHPNIAVAFNNIGAMYAKLEDFDQAIDYYLSSLRISEDPISKTITYRNLAGIYKDAGMIEQSSTYYLKSIENATGELSKDHYEVGNSYLAYGDFLLEQGDYEKAFDFFNETLRIFKLNFEKKNPHISRVYARLGDYFLSKDHLEEALVSYQEALIENIYDYHNSDIYSFPLIDSVVFVNELLPPLMGKGEAFKKLYHKTGEITDLMAAFKAYNASVDIVEDIRLGLRQESMLKYVDDVKGIFQKAIMTCLELFYITAENQYLQQAFEFSERSRSAVLLASMRDVEALEIGGVPDSLKLAERELRERIGAYEKLIYDERNKVSQNFSKIDLWEAKIFNLKRDYDSLISTCEHTYPSYYNLKYDKDILSVTALQNQLSPEDAVIEYAKQDSVLVIFLVRSDAFRTVTVNLGPDFEDKITQLIEYYHRSLFHHTPEVYSDYLRISNDLYQHLIQPVEEYIEGKQLIIIPDGNLNYIPFETLITEIPAAELMDYRGLPYLIKFHPISYSYSATILFEQPISEPVRNDLLAFAPTYSKSGQEVDVAEIAPGTDVNMLDPLNNAELEVDQINNMIRGEVYEGNYATESNFKLHASNYNILHLAMHTIMDDNDPLYSRLVFAKGEDTLNDGLLHAYELYNLDLNADLAVLSACNTGYGKLSQGEGVISIARGFTYAGVPSIVMTLWEVEDKSGAEIMTRFYENIDAGLQKDVALQNAKVGYLNSAPQFRAHPYFWSAYVDIGLTKPILRRNANYPVTILLSAAMLIIIVVASYYYFRRRKQNL